MYLITMTNYSGFLSNFISTTPSSGAFTDILSSVVTTTATYGDNDNPYSCGYFYLGKILVQFTTFTHPIEDYGTTAGHKINFPVQFDVAPWCIVASACTNDGNAGQFTIQKDQIAASSFYVYVNNTGTGLTYIAIGPAPPS